MSRTPSTTHDQSSDSIADTPGSVRGETSLARTDVETAVPPDAPTHVCAYCDRPFADESYLVLHRGLAHAADLSEEEREAFSEAYDEEEADLNRFRIIALGLLVILYFGFLFVFAVVT